MISSALRPTILSTAVLGLSCSILASPAVAAASTGGSSQVAAVSSQRPTSRAALNRNIAAVLVHQRGWSGAQYRCLARLWHRESRWNHRAANHRSGAYGIPQALPGSKMASAGADWRTNPATQIRWGLGYISGRYGTPCQAWAHSRGHGWY